MNRILCIASFCLLLAIGGCAPPYKVQEIYGADYTIDLQVPNGKTHSVGSSGKYLPDGSMVNVATIKCGDVTMVITGMDITINDVPYGSVKKKDKILLTYTKRLYINGTERKKM